MRKKQGRKTSKSRRHKRKRNAGFSTAAAVVYAPDHDSRLLRVLKKLGKLSLQEIIVVLHRDDQRMLEAARSVPGTTVVYSPGIGADEGRALGAKMTTAGTVLFVDGGKPGKSRALAAFLEACRDGLDVALNDITPSLGNFRKRADFYRLAEFLNRACNRSDLRANSLSTLPYALSRKALNAIGPDTLAAPPKAQAAAIFQGLRIGTAGRVKLSNAHLKRPPSAEAAAQRHAEVWREVLKQRGPRLFFPDNVRNRSLLGGSA